MKVLSLFDGMACGMIAMQLAGVDVESYDAYEIDKYAIKTAQHNFPMIKEHGDVFEADFTQYEGVDFLIGGSPCTYWSIAQTKNRETVASGMGWELFSQYVRALHEAKPKYFIYENNKSMSKAIRSSIDETFGFEAVLINSALVSAQNRQRLYWVGRRNEDGTYSKVNVEQPTDRGILLKDILDSAVSWRDKAHTIDANYYKGGNFTSPNKQSGKRLMAAEPINVTEDGKSQTLKAQYCKNSVANFCCYSSTYVASGVAEPVNITQDGKARTLIAGYHKQGIENCCGFVGFGSRGVAEPINVTADGKAQCLRSTCYKDGIRNIVGNDVDRKTGVAEPVCLRYERTEEAKRCRKAYEAHEIKHGYNELNELHPRPDGKTNTLTTVLKDNQIMEPVCVAERGRMYCGQPQHYEARTDGKTNTLTSVEKDNRVAEPINVPYDCDVVITENSIRCQRRDQKHSTVQGSHVNFTDGKTQTLSPSHIPNVIERKDGKEITIYEVYDGKITIKGKQYPIKLKDGYYIIRKLTVSEYKRLQTVPEWYEFPVSNSQAYKMLGNGWTCEVICHLINSCFKPADVLPGQIGLWGGVDG